ncbi:GntG family PLP-dependent aldolase [Haloechinothrix sp. LS1_15]|uniref:threonine aldolase family protein n=1 Tax=Haloechinothrix sp. LS1_15 TaxID=2652248 RepID=UPI002946F6AC|nr:GntG family PLP-dependent aldolase [Haloechinothrix sp. LS1_15]MDV6011190.1 aminotransferase class I/II-fold pyridoxal phosphate-dependent enzyme [Haloechinothrix sp. LS1_15]
MTFAQRSLIDLRSDTLTSPDERMRATMAAAEVGDNVLDVDPTVRELEERTAALLGKEDALWTPSGTMANLIALCQHLQRGDRFLAPRDAHVLNNELGSAAWLAGGMPEALETDAGPGRPSLRGLARAISNGASTSYLAMRTTLLCLENTHNAAGGAIVPADEHAQLVAMARDAGIAVHLDGARLWNAAVALQLPPGALTVGADSVSVCFSKALGAPVGSALAGSAEFIEQARRTRQMLGGGVRQGGVLAAASLHALDRMNELATDHANAARLAAGLAELGWDVRTPQTNIVLAAVADVERTLHSLRELGILALPLAGRVRFVTHRGITADDIDTVLERVTSETARQQARGPASASPRMRL